MRAAAREMLLSRDAGEEQRKKTGGDVPAEIALSPTTVPALVRNDLYYTNDYVIDGCAIIMGTAEGELVRTAR